MRVSSYDSCARPVGAGDIHRYRLVHQIRLGECNRILADFRAGFKRYTQSLARALERLAVEEFAPVSGPVGNIEITLFKNDLADNAGIAADAGAEHDAYPSGLR